MITKSNIKQIRADVQDALDIAAEQHGLVITLGHISYDQDSFTSSIKAQVEGSLTKEEKAYDIRFANRGLPPRGTIIRSSTGKIFEITGWNTRAPKYPIQALGEDDRTWKLAEVMVLNATIIRSGTI